MTYNTAVGDEAAQVQPAVAIGGALKRLLDDGVAVELAPLDGLVDADHVLPDDASGANVEVADLGVAHQALGQAYGEGRGLKLGVTVGVGVQGVHDGRLGVGDGIAILGALLRGDAPAINDDCASARPRELAIRAPGRPGQSRRRGCSRGGGGGGQRPGPWGCRAASAAATAATRVSSRARVAPARGVAATAWKASRAGAHRGTRRRPLGGATVGATMTMRRRRGKTGGKWKQTTY